MANRINKVSVILVVTVGKYCKAALVGAPVSGLVIIKTGKNIYFQKHFFLILRNTRKSYTILILTDVSKTAVATLRCHVL
ncbi:MAG: hypothetical protein JXB19_00910, partial [Bacteroidales bacterium]|nr:hypothetical protein [Bacteroidales bacterium]